MRQIVAKQPTKLCKTPEKFSGSFVTTGEKWGVDQVLRSAEDGKWLHLRLSYSAGDWWVLASHWELPPEAASSPIDAGKGQPHQSPQKTATQPKSGGTQPHRITYYNQKDNFTQANRTCFSSVSAMLLKFYLPDAIDTDDDYLRTVIKCGDTTEAATQLMALRSYGLNPVFAKNWTLDKLKETVCRKPVGIGLLHRSNYLNPTGGHWVLCHGYDYNTKQFLIQDPWESDYDWQAGVYDSVTPGKDQVWPEEALHYRYTVEAKDGNLHSGFSLWIE